MKYLIVLLLGAGYFIVNPIGINKNENSLIIDTDILELIKAPTEKLESINYEITFWQDKINKDEKQLTHKHKLALAYYDRFHTQGTTNDLYKSSALLEEIVTKSSEQNSPFLRSLARNYISQHEFQKAFVTIQHAIRNGDNRRATECILFDIQMELGFYEDAQKTLHKIYHLEDFDYLIRKAKWEDYAGNLDIAIQNLEKALAIAKKSKNEEQQIWLYSNLGDFYTHDNQPKKALKYYQNTLELDPHNYYVFKSIAWLAYAENKNTDLAIAIVNGITSFYKSADLHLFLAELSEFKEDETSKLFHTKKFIEHSKNYPMYRIPQSLVLAEVEFNYEEALKLAIEEVESRNTPETQDNLAWIYFLDGNHDKALEIVDTHVYDKTYEPIAQFHMATIFKYHNKNEISQTFKSDLLTAGLELGPLMLQSIERL